MHNTLIVWVILLLLLTAVIMYATSKRLGSIKVPRMVGLTIFSLGFAIILSLLRDLNAILGLSNVIVYNAISFINSIGFDTLFLGTMISFLLFSAAIRIDFNELSKHKLAILSLSTVSVIISSAVIGIVSFPLLKLFSIGLPLISCFILGSVISPTDPVIVSNVVKGSMLPKALETKIFGEALFNDAVGMMLFLTLLEFYYGYRIEQHSYINIGEHNVLTLLLYKGLGGALLGLIAGTIVAKIIARTEKSYIAILLTIAIVTVGFNICEKIFAMSGIIFTVVAAIAVGKVLNNPQELLMKKDDLETVHNFWSVLDDGLNAALHLMLGLTVLSMNFNLQALMILPFILLVIFFARALSVYLGLRFLPMYNNMIKGSIPIMVWGGVRGGISIALILSLREDMESRDLLASLVYLIVLFSLIVQGSTMQAVVKYLQEINIVPLSSKNNVVVTEFSNSENSFSVQDLPVTDNNDKQSKISSV